MLIHGYISDVFLAVPPPTGASSGQQSHPQTPQTPGQGANGGQSSVPSTPANTG